MKRWLGVFAAVACMAASHAAHAGRIADLFGLGILGTSWGDTPEAVETKHPGGKWKSYGKIRIYTIRDSRTILGLKRETRNTIQFGFNNDQKLSGIDISFPDIAALITATNDAFGAPLKDKNQTLNLQHDMVSVTGIRWADDDGIAVAVFTSAVGFGVGHHLSISKEGLGLDIGKESLGFE